MVRCLRLVFWAVLVLLIPAVASALQVRIVALQTRDVIYNPTDGLLYASVPGSVPQYGNSVTAIDPTTGALGASIFVGSEPGKLALADDGRTLYVALGGAAAVRVVDLQAGTAGLQFNLGSDSFFGPYYAEDMAVQPGHTGVLAVSLQNLGISPRHAGVAIFDNGVVRPNKTQRHTGSNRIEFSTDPSRIYGYNNETTEFGFRRLQVTDLGVTELDVTTIFGGFGSDIAYDRGRVYATSGAVVDGEARTLLGTFPFPASTFGQAVAPDSDRAYYVTGGDFSGPITLYEFDTATFTKVLSQPVSGALGTPRSLVRWGNDGIAFRTDQSQVLVLTRIHEPPTSDLEVTQTDSPDPVQQNESFTYTVVVRCNGPSGATGVIVRDRRPVGAPVQYSYATRGSITDSSGTTIWNVGSLAASDSAVFYLSVYSPVPGTFQNEVGVSSDVPDPNPANNTSIEHTVVREPQRADISVRQALTPAIVGAGGLMTCRIVIGNGGPNEATQVSMGWSGQGFPMSIQSATSTAGTCVIGGGFVSWSNGSLGSGDSVGVQVVFIPLEPGHFVSYASAGSSVPDTAYSNNSSYATATVLPSAVKLLNDLQALVDSYHLRKGAQLNLTRGIEDALAALTASDSSAACASMGDFRRYVGRQAGRQLTLTQAIHLDQDAASIEAVLGCGTTPFLAATAGAFETADVRPFSFRAMGGVGGSLGARLDLPSACRARVEVFDVQGRRVAVLVDQDLAAGSHRISWDGKTSAGDRASAGVYFMRTRAGTDIGVARIVVLR
jgi:uncharacterized repeat protein (TIGR01451 family)